MGQKTHPYGFRLGIVTDWKSRWYSDKDYTALANEDYQIRAYLALSGPATRGRIAAGTNIPVGTVSYVLAQRDKKKRRKFMTTPSGKWKAKKQPEET